MLVSLLLDGYVFKSLALANSALVIVFSIRVEVMKVEIQTQRVYTQVPSAPAELLIPSILSPKRPPNWIFGSLIFCSMREVGFI